MVRSEVKSSPFFKGNRHSPKTVEIKMAEIHNSPVQGFLEQAILSSDIIQPQESPSTSTGYKKKSESESGSSSNSNLEATTSRIAQLKADLALKRAKLVIAQDLLLTKDNGSTPDRRSTPVFSKILQPTP